MPQTIIKLTYRQVIDNTTQDTFEKNILHYSYEEFLIKSQVYNPERKWKTFTELKASDGRANSLHYKSGFAVAGFIDSLKNIIPQLRNNLGKPLAFEVYNFELIESDITDKTMHTVAVHYTTSRLILHCIAGEFLVLGKEDETTRETFTLRLGDDMAIVFLEDK
ncbi:hypothetical protein [Ferruginibacter sp. HRS2-29]|uniref:hypothetical protein n=1 Tax=Ferruginibacter sp. HRS2-29 TaxID=2487334 RepID=UPI0020CBDD9C|nr:hypothetical protein [Ferruginibacter sp. HRS2-29]MCP9751898.1 hypothetical protein [Ferruginibacter sp. HRS2-29]